MRSFPSYFISSIICLSSFLNVSLFMLQVLPISNINDCRFIKERSRVICHHRVPWPRINCRRIDLFIVCQRSEKMSWSSLVLINLPISWCCLAWWYPTHHSTDSPRTLVRGLRNWSTHAYLHWIPRRPRLGIPTRTRPSPTPACYHWSEKFSEVSFNP